jgi:diguanylate cyclase (GGDEF)-like protein/PAS domain S-box-containing protein
MPVPSPLRRLAKSLKLRLALASGVLVLLAVSFAAVMVIGVMVRDAARDALEVQREAAERVAHEVGERMAERRALLAAFAASLPATVASDPAGARRLLRERPLPERMLGAPFVARPDGTVVARTDGLSGASAEGAATARVPGAAGPREAVSIGGTVYFRRLLDTRAPVVSEPIRARAGGRASVMLAHPLLDDEGRVRSIVGARVALDGPGGLDGLLGRPNPHGRTVVIDGAWRVLAHGDRARLLGPAEEVPELKALLARHGAALRGDDPRGAVRVDGRLVAWAAVAGTDWVVFEVADLADRIESALQARDRALLLAALLAAASVAGMLALGAWTFRPIVRLRDRARRVLVSPSDVEGGWPTGDDEVGELGEAFRRILRERAGAERGTLEALSRLQAILQNTSIGIAFVRGGRFELVSPSLAQLTGHAAHELVGKPLAVLADETDDLPEMLAQVDRQLADSGRFDVELPLRRRDGGTLWLRVAGNAVDPADARRGVVWIAEDVGEARRLRQQLAWSAARDPLTELLNRREFEARLDALLDDPNRAPAAVLFIDLDRFKQVNDNGGHAAGDRMLVGLARLIESRVRQADAVARLGGDEFAVLLPGCDGPQATAIAGQIGDAVRGFSMQLDGRAHAVAASIGLVLVDARLTTRGEVMRAADEACYAAKRAGRDAVCVWDESTRGTVEAARVEAAVPPPA